MTSTHLQANVGVDERLEQGTSSVLAEHARSNVELAGPEHTPTHDGLPCHASGVNLKVTANVIGRYRSDFAGARIIVLQHLKADTEEFLGLLESAGAEIFHVIAKPNSYVPEVLARVKAKFPVLLEEYETLEMSSKLSDLLREAIGRGLKDHKRVLILDVGGYFSQAVGALRANTSWPLAGVVEVTTFGHNRYRDAIKRIEFPVFSVARSPIKEIEARFVGNAAATALEQLMREHGRVLQGRRVVMNGFGMIGRNVASALRARGMAVAVTDRRQYPMVDASTQGYIVGTKRELLSTAEFLVSATAQVNAISEADFDLLPDGAYLVSAGSRTNEFDVQLLRTLATKQTQVSTVVEAMQYKGKTLNLVKQGKSVNFLVGSCQEEVMDLLFAEIAACFVRLLCKPPTRLGVLHESEQFDVDQISDLWLKYGRGLGSVV